MTDSELEAFVEEGEAEDRAPPSPMRPTRLLLLGVFAAALTWGAVPLLDEVGYHFSGQEILDLGDIDALGGEMPPPDTYVRVAGVLGNKAAVLSEGVRPGTWRRGPVQFRQVLGAPVFLEFHEDRNDELGAFSTGSVGVPHVRVEGRLVAMPAGGELEEIRQYFERRFAMRISPQARVLIVDERPGGQWGTVALCFGLLLAAGFALVLLIKGLAKGLLGR
jgi:hypothetical protein